MYFFKPSSSRLLLSLLLNSHLIIRQLMKHHIGDYSGSFNHTSLCDLGTHHGGQGCLVPNAHGNSCADRTTHVSASEQMQSPILKDQHLDPMIDCWSVNELSPLPETYRGILMGIF